MSVKSSRTPSSRDELMAPYKQLGTWSAVADHLFLSPNEMETLKQKLAVPTPASRASKSTLAKFHEQIVELAEQGYTCVEIVKQLNLPVRREQLRRYMHRRGIRLGAKQGAQPGEKHRDWKGGRTTDKQGYILVRCPEHPHANRAGYVREHRLVMEQKLGRSLEPEEVVHHINEDPADNRPENLELYASNAEHLKETLKGQVPNWTQEGKERIVQGIQKSLAARRRPAAV